jgi:hypothetical protein
MRPGGAGRGGPSGRVSYDAFMADLVAAEVVAGRRVLVY